MNKVNIFKYTFNGAPRNNFYNFLKLFGIRVIMSHSKRTILFEINRLKKNDIKSGVIILHEGTANISENQLKNEITLRDINVQTLVLPLKPPDGNYYRSRDTNKLKIVNGKTYTIDELRGVIRANKLNILKTNIVNKKNPNSALNTLKKVYDEFGINICNVDDENQVKINTMVSEFIALRNKCKLIMNLN